jgi:LPS-assembly protein
VIGALALLARLAMADEPMPAEVRVLSTRGPRPATTVTVRATPTTDIEDRTVGARPAAPDQGPASLGETFQDEIRLLLRGMGTTRPTVVEVDDDLVSAVRVSPEPGGTMAILFVRRPVTYTVARPSALGDVVITLGARPVAVAATGKRAGPTPVQDGQVMLDAAELDYERDTDVVVARGAVSITRGEVTLRADEVRYDRRSGIAEATGNVIITDPQGTITGSAGRIDLNDESGWMNQATADFLATGYSLTCDRVEKGIGPRYQVEEGRFTTCRCGGLGKPSWSVGGRQAKIELDGLGVVRDATFRVKDVPILWAPILSFPALTSRASGLLMPQFGYSQRRGFQYQQPFFWNISKSQDATIATDIETNARLGILGEYRYALSKTSRGAFAGGYWNESIRGADADFIVSSQAPTPPPPENRWLVLGRASHALSKRQQLYTDIFSVSDQTLLRDIRSFGGTLDTDLRLRSARLTRSRAGGIETWDRGLWLAEADYYQDLIDPQDVVPQRAPDLRADHTWPLLGNQLQARLSGQAVNFQRNEGFDGLRGDVSPELFLPFQVWRALQGSVSGRLHGTMYQLADDRQVALVAPTNTAIAPTFRAIGDTGRLPRLDASHFRGVAVVRGQLGTELARVYDFGFLGVDKLRHSIQPDLRYVYVPDVDPEYYQSQLTTAGAPVAPANCNRQPARSTPECRRYRAQLEQFNTLNGRYVNGTLYSRGYLFDELDAINERNFISYGLTTRLLGRLAGGIAAVTEPTAGSEDDDTDDTPPPLAVPASPTRELARFTIRHGVDPSRTINSKVYPKGPKQGQVIPGSESHLANLDLGLRVNPLTYLSLFYGASYDVVGGQLAAQNAAFTVFEPNYVPSSPFQSPSALNLAYRFVEENVNAGSVPQEIGSQFSNAGVRNLIGSAYLRLGKQAGLAFGAIYDFNEGLVFDSNTKKSRPVGAHFVLREYLFRYISPCNCWAAEVGVQDNFQTDETLYRFQITLLGLGTFGQGRRGLNYTGISVLPRTSGPRPTAVGPASPGFY